MTELVGTFEYELDPERVSDACRLAIDGLGWDVGSARPDRFVVYPNGDFGTDPPSIELLIYESNLGTEVEIIGRDSEKRRVNDDELIPELHRVREALEAQLGGTFVAAPPASLTVQRKDLRNRVREYGGSMSIPVSALMREFGLPGSGPGSADKARALLASVGLHVTPPLEEVGLGDRVTLTLIVQSQQAPDQAPDTGQGTGSTAPGGRTDRPRLNRLARIAFLLSVIWLAGVASLLAIMAGGVALRQIDASQGGQEGRTLAMTAIILGAVGTVIAMGVAIAIFGS